MRNEPFIFHNGRSARTIPELLQIIEESQVAVFEEHVTKDRNDFASWVEVGLGEAELAKKLRTTKDRIATISMLRDWLKPKVNTAGASAVAPAPHFLDTAHQKEFLWGLLVGLILGVILFRIIMVVNGW